MNHTFLFRTVPKSLFRLLLSFFVCVFSIVARSGEIVTGTFQEGNLDGWNVNGVVSINGEGLQASYPVGSAAHLIDFPIGAEGTLLFKATVWPKGGADNWISIGFFPHAHKPHLGGGLGVLLRGEPIGVEVGSLNGGMTEDTPGNSGVLKIISYGQVGLPPYSVELAYSPQLKSVTLTINGNVLFENIPISFQGVVGEAPPPEFFAFAGIVFFNQEGKEGEPGTVQNVTVEWNP